MIPLEVRRFLIERRLDHRCLRPLAADFDVDKSIAATDPRHRYTVKPGSVKLLFLDAQKRATGNVRADQAKAWAHADTPLTASAF